MVNTIQTDLSSFKVITASHSWLGVAPVQPVHWQCIPLWEESVVSVECGGAMRWWRPPVDWPCSDHSMAVVGSHAPVRQCVTNTREEKIKM